MKTPKLQIFDYNISPYDIKRFFDHLTSKYSTDCQNVATLDGFSLLYGFDDIDIRQTNGKLCIHDYTHKKTLFAISLDGWQTIGQLHKYVDNINKGNKEYNQKFWRA